MHSKGFVVAARLRHADPSITLWVYAHVINQQLVEAAEIFAKQVDDVAQTDVLLARNPLAVTARGLSAGAPEGIRTPNLLIRSQMLYPLSYGCLPEVLYRLRGPDRESVDGCDRPAV